MRRCKFRTTLAAVLLMILTFACAPSLLAADDAATTFKEDCSTCHGADGSGTDIGRKLQAPDLRSKHVQSQTDAQLFAAIKNGKGQMPPHKDLLTDAEIKQLVKYVRTLAAKK
ncbi:MAG TPA: cytochrome c [Candidatus Acidoferrales bacterium]